MTANAADAPPALAAAEVVAGRYRVDRLLGREAVPVVETYAVTDLLEQRPLVLKLLVPAGPGSGVTLRSVASVGWQRAWLSQQGALQGVRHPAVPHLTEARIDEASGRAWVVREPLELEGQNLRDVLAARGRAFSEAEAILVVAQIGEAVEAVHQHGLCHRALSPSRIFLVPDGPMVRVRVADFALLPARWIRECAEPGYLAPEQITAPPAPEPARPGPASSAAHRPLGSSGPGPGSSPSDPALVPDRDRRADQFALGVILYELLAGQPAFIASATEPREAVLARIVNEDPLPLSLSRPVELSLSRALSRSPAVRFPSVRELIRALGGDTARWPQAVPAPPSPSSLHGGLGDAPRRIFLPMATGALIALAGLAAFAWLYGPTPSRLPDLAAADSGSRPAAPPPRAASDAGPPDALLGDTEAADLEPEAGSPHTSRWPRADDPSIPPLRLNEPDPRSLQPVGQGQGQGQSQGSGQGNGSQGGTGASTQAPAGLSPPQISVPTGPGEGELTAEQKDDLLRCVRIVQPSRPYRVRLDNIGGRLLVAEPSSAEFSGSQDFRDCLKLRVRGTLVPKVVMITGLTKGRPTP